MSDYRKLMDDAPRLTAEDAERARQWAAREEASKRTFYSVTFGDSGEPFVSPMVVKIRPRVGKWEDLGHLGYEDEAHAGRNGFFPTVLAALQDAERRAKDEHATQERRLSRLMTAIAEARRASGGGA